MKMSPLACLAGVLFLLGSLSLAEPQASARPVALIYVLAGEATLTLPTRERRPLRLFDRLPAGTVVEVGPGSRVALAFQNGRRFELRERSRATLGPADLTAPAGMVRSLPAVPPLPRLLPIAEEEQPGMRHGAVHIRAERIEGLYPSQGAAALATGATLRFELVEGGGSYRVEVQDSQGNVIFSEETAGESLNIPSGILQPGLRYHWTVRTVDRAGPVARGDADFVTLPSGLAAQREALRKAVEASEDGDLRALLEEVDRSLGLVPEALSYLQFP